jgi:hypothetical protein
MTTFEMMNRSRTLDITISEVERDNNARMLVHIDLEKQVALEMMIAVTMLIYAVRLALQSPECVTIHNQCLNIELVSPVYFGNGVVCPKLSDRQIGIGTTMRTCLEIYATHNEFEGALLFKLQRYFVSQ